MTKRAAKICQRYWAVVFAIMLASSIGVGRPLEAKADATVAKAFVKAMSDYVAAQKVIELVSR